jgi:uncharacterized BrkB/YihY/UPF0761 family membrane protein
MSGKNVRFDKRPDQKKVQLINRVTLLVICVVIFLFSLLDNIPVGYRALVELLLMTVSYISILVMLWCYHSLPPTSDKWNLVAAIVATLGMIGYLIATFLLKKQQM